VTPAREFEILIDHPDAAAFPLAALRELGIFALDREPAGADFLVVTVLLTGAERVQELHRDFMGLDSETDIMTFPAELEPGVEGRGGDIVISVDAARENGMDAGHSTWEEVRFLALHGILHLCGWDDRNDADRVLMLARQSAIIAEFDARG
jgi:rRNA maturation RNase YbeY